MARPRTRRRDDRVERKPKKRVSILDSDRVVYVDYKDVNLLRRFMSERAKIRARRVTGNDTQQQREVARAIRVAREMALLPYSVRQVTHRSKRRGERDGERGDRGLAMPDTMVSDGVEELDGNVVDGSVVEGELDDVVALDIAGGDDAGATE